MDFDGRFSDLQLTGDHLIRGAIDEVPQDLALAGGQHHLAWLGGRRVVLDLSLCAWKGHHLGVRRQVLAPANHRKHSLPDHNEIDRAQ